MVWGAFSFNGPLPLYRIIGGLKAADYIILLEQRLLPALTTHPQLILQQDNAPARKAR